MKKKKTIIMTHYSGVKNEKPELLAKIILGVLTAIIAGLVILAAYYIITGK